MFDTPDQFDQRRIRLADIDGSGTADLVYLGARRGDDLVQPVRATAGHAGTSCPSSPPVDNIADVNAFDLLGCGTACLVWTSPLPAQTAQPLRYIDLTGGVKPYLLTSVDQQPRRARSRSATRRRPSSTCRTGPPAPPGSPGCRSRCTWSSGSRPTTPSAAPALVSTYSYHHGYYDGVEREFRGFARVDQLDADTVPAASGTGMFTSHPAGGRGRLHPAAGLDPHLVPHRCLLRRRRHRRRTSPPSTTSSTRRPLTWAPRSCRRARAPKTSAKPAGPCAGGCCARRSTPLTACRRPSTPTPPASTATRCGCCSRPRAGSLRRVLRLGAGGAVLPLRADPADPRISHAAHARRRRLRERHQDGGRRLPAATPGLPRAGGRRSQLHRGRRHQRRRPARLVPDRPAGRDPRLRAHRHRAQHGRRSVRPRRPADRGGRGRRASPTRPRRTRPARSAG